jgi:hypothetical protein
VFIPKQDWKLKPESSESKLRLSGMTIPKGSLDQAGWDIMFDGATDDGAILTIHMRGREPRDFAVDY